MSAQKSKLEDWLGAGGNVDYGYEVGDETVWMGKSDKESWDAVVKSATRGAPLYYKKGGGSYTNDPSDADASSFKTGINLDTKNKSVNIQAPKSLLESEAFKNTFDSSTFKTVVKSYMDNPNGEIPLADGTSKKTAEALEEYKRALQEMAQQRPILDNIAEEQKALYGLSGLTDQQLITSASGVNSKSNKSDAVPLPAQVIGGYDFSQLGSFDADNMTISKEDFDKFNVGKAFDDEHVKRAREEAKAAIQTLVQAGQDENYKYTDAEKDEAVRWQSFYRSLMNNRPNLTAPAALGNAIEGLVTGVSENIGDLASGLGQVMEAIGENIPLSSISFTDDNGEFTASFGVAGALIQSGQNLQALAALGTMFDDILKNPSLTAGSEGAGNVFSKFGASLADIYGMPVSEEWRNKVNDIAETYAENWQTRNDMTGALAAGNLVGNLIGEALRQVTFVNPIGRAIGSGLTNLGAKTVSGLSNLTKVLSRYGTANEIASLAKASITAQTAAATISEGGSKAVTLLSKIADVTAQGVIDTLTHDSEAMQKLYENGDTSGLANELKSNFIWNAIGEAGALGGAKLVETVGETKVGQAVALAYGKKVNALAAVKNQVKLAVENKLSKLKVFGDQIGAGTRTFTEAVIETEKRAAKATTIEEFNAAIKARTALENDFDSIRRGPRAQLGLMRSDPLLSKSLDNYDTSVTKLSAAIEKSGDKLMAGTKMSQEAANYLSLKMQLQRALNDPTQATSKWAQSLEEKVGSLGESLEKKGFKNLADDVFEKLEQAQAQLTKYQLREGVVTTADIEGYRSTGYWGKEGEQFFHTSYIKEGLKDEKSVETALSEYYKSAESTSARKFHATEAKNYKLTKTELDGDYLDPTVVFAGELYRTASDIQRRSWGRSLLNASGVNKVLGEVGETTAKAHSVKNLSSFQKKVIANVEKTAGGDYQLTLDELFPQVKKAKVSNAAEAKKLASEKVTATRSYNKAVDSYAGMQMNVNDVNEIRVGVGGKHNIPDFDAGQMTEGSFQEVVEGLDKNTTKLMQAQINEVIGEGAELNFTNYAKTYNAVEGLDLQLTRSYINNNSAIKKTKAYKDVIRRVKTENNNFRGAAFLDKYQKKYDTIVEKYKEVTNNPFGLKGGGKDFRADIEDMVQGIRENFAGKIKESAEGRNLIKAMVDEGLDEDTAIQYLVVDTLHRMNPAVGGKKNQALRNSVKNYLTGKEGKEIYGNIALDDLDEFANTIGDMADDIIESEWNTMTRSLMDGGHADMVDIDEVFARVQKYADDIIGEAKDPSKNIIEIMNGDGKLQYVETDPLTKDLYEWRPNYADSTPSTFFSLTNRFFRLGTTNLSVKSFYNQWVKDPMNAYVAGGAVPFLNRGMSNFFGGDAYAKINDSIVESMQDKVIAGLKSELGDEGWRLFEIQAKEQGKSIGRAAVEYELITRPQIMIDAGGTETKFYQDLSRARNAQYAYEYGGQVAGIKQSGNLANTLDNVFGKLEDVLPNNARESYLRNLVYGAQYQQALSKGKSISEARAIAERFMQDATTNFGRPLAMGNRIARSVPYLNAAFNGKASFMRLLELDPAGVTGRFLGGVVLPYMALLAESLGKAENAEVYRNMKEYEKEGSLTVVVNGQPISIPLPEELSAFLNPFRQAVEKAHDANDHSWSELVANDLLQLPVMDLSGYYDVDQGELGNSPTFWERVGRGTEKLVFGQMAPAAVKSAYMAITGRDPYTGYGIDRSYVYDDGEGGVQIMDSNDNKIAVAVSSWAKSVGINLSPSAAYSILGNTFGKGVLSLGDTLGSILSGEPTSTFGETASGLQSSLLPQVRDKAADAWKSAVNALYEEKKKMLDSEEWERYAQAISSTANISDEKRQQYISNWKTYAQDYINRVMSASSNMYNKYGMTVAQQASVISLLTFADNSSVALTAAAREEKNQLYSDARAMAIRTMQEMGFQGTTDLSIFGYGTYQLNYDTGQREYKYKYNSPVDILNMGNEIWGASRIALGNIKDLLDNGQISKDLKEYKKERSAMYDKASSATDKKTRNQIYDNLEEMDTAWNSKVMRAIVPYIDSYGLGDLLDNKEVSDYLEQYIYVPSSIMGKAQYISSKTGIDKNEAFIEYYIKKWYENYNKARRGGK